MTICSEPNVFTFQNISEKDFGFYRCEVKEAGKLVLTVYRVLYRDESSTCDTEHSTSGMQDYRPYLTTYTRTGDTDIVFVLRSGFTVLLDSLGGNKDRKRPHVPYNVEPDTKRQRSRSLSGAVLSESITVLLISYRVMHLLSHIYCMFLA